MLWLYSVGDEGMNMEHWWNVPRGRNRSARRESPPSANMSTRNVTTTA